MSLTLEWKKAKRTGLFGACIGAGLLGAAVPVLNMAVRSELYLGMEGEPLQILVDANWQMMALLNLFFVIAAACMLYHTEHEHGAIRKMRTLPVWESSLFFGKAALLFLLCALLLSLEAGGMACCLHHWFAGSAWSFGALFQTFAGALLLLAPGVLLSLWLSAAWENMWMPLGIGTSCIFLATMLSGKGFFLSCFPYALPFQAAWGMDAGMWKGFLTAGVLEGLLFAGAGDLFLRIRRIFA